MSTERDIAIEIVKHSNHDYYTKAYGFAKEWVKETFKPFSSEDLKEAYYKAGNEPPKEPRVFGAIMNELKKESLIYFHKYQKYKNPAGHCRPSTVWISHEYRKKQQSNSLASQQAQTSLF